MKDIHLFDYQEDMKLRIEEAFKLHQSVMAQMPTGTGKTYLLAAIVKDEEQRLEKQCLAAKSKANPCIWVVAHRRELVGQAKETLERFLPSCSISSVRVMSIQWLSKHYLEMGAEPSLIVVDEAHHALAETYAEVINAFPDAKKLGLTATPCRMDGKGFAGLFDTLLCSWSMERFIAEGKLSLYDYYSIKPGSADQILIDSLQKRGADGDYQQKELNDTLDVRPSLQRLCLTIRQYVPGKKGIVYAISIRHAEHIAEFYRENGIKAVAISSKTPPVERQKLIERFKRTTVDDIQVLVNVDLFSEGFDCPDVEFIQLARPTLSLSKYIQMAGRGLRVTESKECCVILDNVGLYRRFGLPSADRDWLGMFGGRTALEKSLQEACLHVNSHSCRLKYLSGGDGEMVQILSHERLRIATRDTYCYQVVNNGNGLMGIMGRGGKIIVGYIYKKIELTEDGFACCHTDKKRGQKPWIDLTNGLCFATKPQPMKLMGIDFCTVDGNRLYPRIGSKFIDENAWLTVKTLELQVGIGLMWKRRLIPWDCPGKVYYHTESVNGLRLYIDDNDNCVMQENIDSPLIPVPPQDMMENFYKECAEKYERDQMSRLEIERKAQHYTIIPSNISLAKKETKEKDGIIYTKSLRDNKLIWVDTLTRKIYTTRPSVFKRGFVALLESNGWCYVRNIPCLADKPFHQWEIVADDNVCVIKNKFLFVRCELRQWFKIYRRTDDFSYFIVKKYSPVLKCIEDDGEITITQFNGERLIMTKNGKPYTPHVQRGCAQDLIKYGLLK